MSKQINNWHALSAMVKEKLNDATRIQQSDIIEFVEKFVVIPSNEALVKRHIKIAAGKLISFAFRDKDGKRAFYAVKDDGKTIYIQVDNEAELKLVKYLKGSLEARVKGIENPATRAQTRIDVLERQLTLTEATEGR